MADRLRVAGVVLAAGSSRRLGRPKQLVALRGRPLLQHAIDAAAAAGLDEVVVVVGHDADRVIAAVDLPPVARTVLNPLHATGQASSLRAGIAALGDASDRAVIILGDQPTIDAAVIAAVAQGPGPIRRARYRGDRPGHPVAFDRVLWPDLLAIQGDRGARDLIATRPALVHDVPVDAEVPADVDTEADLRQLGGA